MTTDQRVQVNPNYKFVNIIGCSFAGIETALFLAGHGLKVHVFNTLNGANENIEENNVSVLDRLLLKELSLLGSPLAKEKITKNVSNKDLYDFGLNMLKDNENIEFFDASISELNPREINVIAMPNCLNQNICGFLKEKYGSMKVLDNFPYFPIVDNVGELLLVKNNAKENEYLYHLNEKEYLNFINQVVDEINKLKNDKEFQKNTIESLVDEGRECLKKYMMQPIISDGVKSKPYASMRLKRCKKGFEIQNFVTNLPKSSQNRIIRSLIPFKNAIIIDEAFTKKGIYLNSKYVINKFGQSQHEENIFFAGEILGLDGYIESMASGLAVGMNVLKFVCGKRMINLPCKTAIGKIMTANCCDEGISVLKSFKNKIYENKLEEYYNVSKKELDKYKEDYINGKYV